MKQQPNFEAVKRIFYNSFVNSEEANFSVVSDSLTGKLQEYFPKRKQKFNAEFNKWLDNIDIRQAGELIRKMKDRGVSLPTWMKNHNYTIEYNQHGFLDLIKH